jgi:hypothetical protein
VQLLAEFRVHIPRHKHVLHHSCWMFTSIGQCQAGEDKSEIWSSFTSACLLSWKESYMPGGSWWHVKVENSTIDTSWGCRCIVQNKFYLKLGEMELQ